MTITKCKSCEKKVADTRILLKDNEVAMHAKIVSLKNVKNGIINITHIAHVSQKAVFAPGSADKNNKYFI